MPPAVWLAIRMRPGRVSRGWAVRDRLLSPSLG